MLNFVINILLVIGIIGILVFIHEMGHLIAAKLVNAKVFEFALGFGPKLISKTWGETEYCIRLLPIGGYVRILGEAEEDDEVEKDRNLRYKKPWQKIIVMVAGVFMNFVLASIIYFFLLAGTGFRLRINSDMVSFNPIGATISKEVVGDLTYASVAKDSPAQTAKFPDSGTIAFVDGTKLNSDEFRNYLATKKNQDVTMNICNKDNVCNNYPVKISSEGKVGLYLTDNVITYLDYSKNKAFAGSSHAINYSIIMVSTIGEIFKTAKQTGDYKEVTSSMSGPIGIYLIVDQLKAFGVVALLELMASFSLTLAIMNLLPIPALDGGRILLSLVEVVTRKPLNRNFEAIVINISFIFLLIFMALIMLKDIIYFKSMKELIDSLL